MARLEVGLSGPHGLTWAPRGKVEATLLDLFDLGAQLITQLVQRSGGVRRLA